MSVPIRLLRLVTSDDADNFSHRRSCNVRIRTYVTEELGKRDQYPEISELAEFDGSRLAQRIPIGKSVNRKIPGVWMIGFQREKFISRKLILMRKSGFHHYKGKKCEIAIEDGHT